MEKGYLCLVLHAHLPFVRHPEYPDFLEENWFFEAITETYIPLLETFNRLSAEGVDFRVTVSLTPTLISMLTDPLLQNRYARHMEKLIELAEKEAMRTRWQQEFHELALMYHGKFTNARQRFLEEFGANLVSAFRQLQETGKLEILTCAATHGYLPLMNGHRPALRAQVRVAVQQYEQVFGSQARGIWLPECGYEPGIDQVLKEEGIEYFITETHGILHASPRPKFGVFAPIYCPSGVAAFARDMESSKQVWSVERGYPGDYWYRDFYRDIGFDLEYEYIRPYLGSHGIRVFTGIKYYRITGKTDEKQPYVPQKGWEKANEHAGNFMFNRERQIEYLRDFMDKPPIVMVPYDAELFGHWWYEGPEWLEMLLRKAAFDQTVFKMITPSEYLRRYSTHQVTTPSASSWGYKGYHEVWLEGSNNWIYRHLHKAAERMTELANEKVQPTPLETRALNQAARELLLAQSSDWAFMMKTGDVAPYAVNRTRDHILRFIKLYQDTKSGQIDERWLGEIEGRDNIFPRIDYRVYRDMC
jgi:1,4-alpha-glucan branching enzyme